MEGAEPSQGASGWEIILQLPPDILVNHVLVPYCSRLDKQALRQTSRLCRRLANAAVSGCVLDAYTDNRQVQEQLPSSFPNLRTLRVACTPPTVANRSSSSGSGEGNSGSSDNIQHLQQQLPMILPQLPCLSHLVYEGPRDRRQPGLNITPALQALAAAAGAAAGATPAAAPAIAGGQAPSTAAAAAAGGAAGPGAASAMRTLELTSGSLPDALMEAVGSLAGIRVLKLNATAAIYMAPVAKLTGLSSVTLTVTPPLPAAIWPLSRLTRLQALQLSALSPARGWGATLAQLAPACPVDRLSLSFADIGDDDMRALCKALTGITYLNLNYSRHLSTAAVPHLAALPNLQFLHLRETALTLGVEELLTLGDGCSSLHTLEAAFDLRAVPLPRWAAYGHGDARAVSEAARLAAANFANIGLGDPTVDGGVSSSGHFGAATAVTASSSTNSSCKVGGGGSGRRGSCWPRLQKLVLNGVSVSDFDKLVDGFPQLTSLVLSHMGLLGNVMLLDLARHAPRPPPIQELTLSDGGPFHDVAIDALRDALPCLKAVTLSHLNLMTTMGEQLLSGLAAHASSLESLHVHGNAWIDDFRLMFCVARLTNLRHLELSQCPKISNDGVVTLAAKLPRLTKLVLKECERVGPDVVKEWERAVAAAARADGGPTWYSEQKVSYFS